MKNISLKLVILFLVVNPIFLKSQYPGINNCDSTHQGSYYSIDELVICPPYSTSMPLDVFIGYFAMDSLGRYVNYGDYENFIKRRIYDDTTKIMMRYIYQVMEYNPQSYLNFTTHNKYPNIPADDFVIDFTNKLHSISTQPILDGALVGSFLIAKITVNNIDPYIDTTAVWAKTCRTVTARVDSVFKGIPPVTNYVEATNPKENHFVNNSNMIFFEYCKEWYENDNLDILPVNFELEYGKSYLMFFEYRVLCYDEVMMKNYYVVYPIRQTKSKTTCIYKIENNNILDPDNELGFGTSVNQSLFFQLLNNKINQIKTFTP